MNHLGDPVEIQAKLEKAWRRVWQKQNNRGDNWETMMGTLNTMPDFPDRIAWTGDTVCDTLKRMARNKAPGLDEWRVYEMRAWPKHLHEAAAALLNEVEQTGSWPSGSAPKYSEGRPAQSAFLLNCGQNGSGGQVPTQERQYKDGGPRV